MKSIFLISGFAESGKDTFAKFVQKHANGKTLILHNADYLKYICKEYMGWDGKKDETGRNLLQLLGTEKIRMKLNKPLFWIEKTCDIIEILQDDFDYFCVADSRYINELHYPKARFPRNAYSIRIHRNTYENSLTPEQRLHISETELKDYQHDFYLYMNEGLDFVEKQVVNFLKIHNF